MKIKKLVSKGTTNHFYGYDYDGAVHDIKKVGKYYYKMTCAGFIERVSNVHEIMEAGGIDRRYWKVDVA